MVNEKQPAQLRNEQRDQCERCAHFVLREACARVCEAEGARVDASWASCAAAIRARGQQPQPDTDNPSF